MKDGGRWNKDGDGRERRHHAILTRHSLTPPWPSLINNKQLILKQVKELDKVDIAASADIDQLGKQLQGVSLKWVVSRLPVVALFGNQQEQQHLGEPFVRNAQSDLRLLWIGVDEYGHALITLTQRLSTPNNNKHSRLLHFIIPTRSLSFDVHAPVYWTITHDNVPSTIVEQPSDQPSATNARLLRISLDLGSASRSRVIMPFAPVTIQLSPSPVALLRRLRTLSSASTFDLYTNYDAFIADDLRQIEALLRQHYRKTSIRTL